METLLELDKNLFIFLNSLGSERFDGFWLFITKQFNWIPIFLIILYLVFKHLGWKHALLIILVMALLIALTDQTTNLFKNYFQRLRPVNNTDLDNVIHFVHKRSSFSFISGHASNSMAAAFFLYKVLKPYLKYMGFIFLWPLVFAYSRIYLGLHYPGDILAGYTWGILMALLMLKLYTFLRDKYFPEKEQVDHPTNDAPLEM
ncbi:phosphatase PAP2 family protein [Flavobacterium macacae]|uniref:Phosphatase PAP2 family protein n=1 Tax=Flavobacterium macacae TaxID=2488993 RepID=A0A3P3W7E6_9FLAO|nr:phosphatase PAP2 family protein [Flavobacterium macacae]RRJ91102.1 phosphatase PAP2 family protein [Flavobacterium macacae]